MHLYVIMRGHKQCQDRFVNDLMAQYLPYEYLNPTTKIKETGLLQLGVRPIQLYEITFPHQHLQHILRTMEVSEIPLTGVLGITANLLKKTLKLLPIPKIEEGLKAALSKDAISVIGIGIKDDNFTAEGIEDI